MPSSNVLLIGKSSSLCRRSRLCMFCQPPWRAFTQRAGCSFRAELVGCKLGEGGGQIGHPVITFLATVAAPAGITAVIGAAAILDIMVMVGSKAAVDAVLFQDFRHGIIIRFHGPSCGAGSYSGRCAALCGQACRQTAHIAFVKADGMGCQTLKVGGRDGAAVHAQQIRRRESYMTINAFMVGSPYLLQINGGSCRDACGSALPGVR